MTAPSAAVLAVLTGAVVDPIPVDITAGAWTCPRCRRVLHVVLTDDPDGWLPGDGCACGEGVR